LQETEGYDRAPSIGPMASKTADEHVRSATPKRSRAARSDLSDYQMRSVIEAMMELGGGRGLLSGLVGTRWPQSRDLVMIVARHEDGTTLGWVSP
jgi:hypothetical protein